MTINELWEFIKLGLPIINSFMLIIFSLWIIILKSREFKRNDKINNLKYWINSIDKDELIKISPHDARYLDEARKILDVV